MNNRTPNLSEGSKQRLRYVDMAKCVMLMFVIVSHTKAWFVELPVDPVLISTFWICSGYTTGSRVDLRRKARGLLVPYLVMSVLCMLFSSIVVGNEIGWTDILGVFYSRYVIFDGDVSLSNPCLMRMFNAPLWFLTSLFTGWCVYALLERLRGPRAQALAALASLALAWGATFLPVLLPWSADTALFAGPMIWAGRCMRRHGVPQRLGLLSAAFLLALYALSGWLQGWSNYSVRYYGHWWPSAVFSGITGVVLLLMLCRLAERSRLGSLLSLINRQALYIFGLQMIFIGLVPRHLPFMDGWPQILAAALLLSICGGWMTGWVMTRAVRVVSCLAGRVRTRLRNGI